MQKSTIRLSQVLNEMDMSVLPTGKQHSFSITFIKSNGESVFILRTIKTGLNMNLKQNAMRGIRPVDAL
ncbi:MAG: hypothetical protein ACOYOV_13280 [Bacteroidales bacterium]